MLVLKENNSRSTDNVRSDWGFADQSIFLLAGYVDQSHSIVLNIK